MPEELPEEFAVALADYERHLAVRARPDPAHGARLPRRRRRDAHPRPRLGHDLAGRPSTCARCAAGWPSSRRSATRAPPWPGGHRGTGVHRLGPAHRPHDADPGAQLGRPRARRPLPPALTSAEAARCWSGRVAPPTTAARSGCATSRSSSCSTPPGSAWGAVRARRRRPRPRTAGSSGSSARAARNAPCPTASRPTRPSAAGWSVGRPQLRVPGAGAALFLGVRGGRIDQRAVRTLVHRPARRRARGPRPGPARPAAHGRHPPARGRRRPAQRCRSCSATPPSPPPRSTPTSPPTGCARPTELAHPQAHRRDRRPEGRGRRDRRPSQREQPHRCRRPTSRSGSR